MSQEGIDLLTRMERHLASIENSLRLLVAQKRAEQPKAIASDRDLNGKYGDPVVKFMPRDWTGPSFKGRRMSECPPALLDVLAQSLDYFGDQAEKNDDRTTSGKPVADFKRADAARARGWAQRIRDGRHVQTTETTATDGWADGQDEETADTAWATAGEGF